MAVMALMHSLLSHFKSYNSLISAIASGLIVLAVITWVLILQATAIRDSEAALDSTSNSIRAEVAETISLELANLVSLVYTDAMQLATMFKVNVPTRTTFTDESLFEPYVQSLFPFVFNDRNIDSMSGSSLVYKDYIGVVAVKTNSNFTGPDWPATCTNTWYGSALRTQDASSYMTDQQYPNASLPSGSTEIRRMRAITFGAPGEEPRVGNAVSFPPALTCPQAMGSLMFPAINGALNADHENFAYFGPFDPGIGWGFHFEGSTPLYADAARTVIDGRATAAISLRGISDLLRRLLDSSGTVMLNGEAMLYSADGEVWGMTEEPYDTVDTTDDDLMARCTVAQASCPQPISPQTCSVACIDSIRPGHTRDAVAATRDAFQSVCPTTRWAPSRSFGGRLIDVTPFDFEEHGMPPFPGRWCILTTTPRGNIYEDIDQARDSSTSVFVGAIVGAVLALLLMGQALVSATLARRRLEHEKYKAKISRVTKAANTVTTCGFSVCFVKFTAFEKHGKLIPHEEALINGDLVFLHTYQDVLAFISVFNTAFFSHQWLSSSTPDPNRVHYNQIVEASKKLLQDHELTRESLYLWIDYLSIPQRNTVLKSLSIASLGVYASVSRFFVIIAPDTQHENLTMCNTESYQSRGWCRLEQWARIAIGGFKQMYIWADIEGKLDPLVDKPKWYYDSIHVFQGQFTNPADKATLVDTVCGVWAHALRETATDSAMLVELVHKHKATIFPKEYFDDLIDILEARIDSLQFEDQVAHNQLPTELGFLNGKASAVKLGWTLRELIGGNLEFKRTSEKPPKDGVTRLQTA